MGDIRHQLCFHPLILDLFLHRFLEALLDLLQLILDRIEQADVALNGHIQMTFRELIGRSQEQLIFPLQIICIFSQEKEQDD